MIWHVELPCLLNLFTHILSNINYYQNEKMESFCRGQPLAWHSKVVHHGPGCVKASLLDEDVLDCSYDNMSPDPSSGRDMSDAPQSKMLMCDKKRCKTCVHIVVSDTFTSNVSGRVYNVHSKNSILDCASSNVIYLISCNRCGVQYVRLNNHCNGLKQLCNLYLYNQFN